MDRPFFSIIIPTHNRLKFVEIAIESVLKQTFTDFELLVIDDGSTDSTEQALDTIADPRIIYIKQAHSGVSAARNNALNQAKGEFICFLDSDDRFRLNKLEITKHYIDKHPQYKIFHTQEIWYRSGALLPQKIHHIKPSGTVFKEAVKSCCISISTVAVHKGIFKVIGNFDEKMPACEDYDFWLRVSAKFPVYLIDKFLTIKEGGHSDQQSKKYPAMDKFRIYALEKILKSGDLPQDLKKIAYEELKNKCTIYIQGCKKRNKTSEVLRCQKIIEQSYE